jgi:hypothetical protein
MQRIHVSLVAARANECRGMTIDQPPRNPPTQQPQLPRCTPHPPSLQASRFLPLILWGTQKKDVSGWRGVFLHYRHAYLAYLAYFLHYALLRNVPRAGDGAGCFVSTRQHSIAYSLIMSRNEREKQPTHWTVYRTQHGRHRDVVSLN